MKITLGKLDKKTLLVLVFGVGLILFIRFVLLADRPTASVTSAETIPQAEKRLAKLRQVAATVQGKEELLKRATTELMEREKGVSQAPTEAQAQAGLLEMLNTLARNNGINPQGGEFHDKPLTQDYGEITATVRFGCDITQLVNLLADLADQPQIIATREIRISSTREKTKNINVVLTVSGVVPRKLLPEKRGGTF